MTFWLAQEFSGEVKKEGEICQIQGQSHLHNGLEYLGTVVYLREMHDNTGCSSRFQGYFLWSGSISTAYYVQQGKVESDCHLC